MFGFGQNRRHSSSGGQGGAWWSGIVGASLAALGTNVLASRLRGFGREAVRSWFDRLLEDPYSENLWELVSATRRTGAQAIVENSLRAAHGAVIRRPLGSPRRWPGLDGLVFDPAQLSRRPAPHDAPVDMRVTLGPAAPRPLAVDIPILVAGMAYGLALSLPAKVALARGAALAGTAINGGEGPVTPLERQAAGKLILQYHRAPWGKDPESLAQADMIEIHIGQGASTGVGTEVVGARTDARLRAQLGVGPGRKAVIRSHHPELEAMPLADLVARLRDLTRGGPIGVKLAPGRRLEEDLAVCLDARVDVIALDGAQAGTKGSPPILQDDFGLPTLHGLVRAVRFLESAGVRDRVSLVVGGGLFAPGDFLKVLALGADAVYIGTAALFAISHGQTFKSLPWEPPTQLVFYGGHQAHRLDVDEAADRLARFLRSAAAEMAIAVRALGKTAIRDVGKEDLTALDPHTARVCGVPVSYRAPLRVSPAISARRPPEVR